MAKVAVEKEGPVTVVSIDRFAEARNAVDPETAILLREAFLAFDRDESQSVAILTGRGGTFCAGYDLKVAANRTTRPAFDPANPGPMGPTRHLISKPVIAAVEGYAVAGGLELAVWCDLRVAAATATFGVFCRRFGVPLVDGGTVRLPRLIGESRAMDLILTGRAVGAVEALALGLANRVVTTGEALPSALQLAREIAAFPQQCLRNDRLSARRQHGSATLRDALAQEFALGRATLASGEAEGGARRFVEGAGKHGRFGDA